MPFNLIGWTLKDVVGSKRFVAVISSLIGLVTIGSWVRHDSSPLVTVGKAAGWLGFSISRAMAKADAWLNASRRHDVLAVASVVVFLVALLAMLQRTAAVNAERQAINRLPFEKERIEARVRFHGWMGRCQVKFWGVSFMAMGLLAALHEMSSTRAQIALIAILALLGGAAIVDEVNRQKDEWREYTRILPAECLAVFAMEVLFSVALAALALAEAPIAVWRLIVHPRIPGQNAAPDVEQIERATEKVPA